MVYRYEHGNMSAFHSMPSNQQLIFYYYPRACSLAVHIVLEESGLVYERRMVDLPTKQNSATEYLAINPKGTVPALVVDGQTLTETQAILTFLGDIIGDGKFLPPTGDFRRYRAHEWMNFLSSSVHTYIRSIFRSAAYAGESQVANDAVNAQGVNNLAGAVARVEGLLTDQVWSLGADFSVVDAYLFVMYLWTTDARISSVPERPNWEAVAKKVWQRPAVQRVISIERKHRNIVVPWE